MDRPPLLLELNISDNTSLNELKIIYSLIKYVPWNEKEILEVKRVHSIIKHRRGYNFYNPNSFKTDIVKVKTPYPRDIQPIKRYN